MGGDDERRGPSQRREVTDGQVVPLGCGRSGEMPTVHSPHPRAALPDSNRAAADDVSSRRAPRRGRRAHPGRGFGAKKSRSNRGHRSSAKRGDHRAPRGPTVGLRVLWRCVRFPVTSVSSYSVLRTLGFHTGSSKAQRFHRTLRPYIPTDPRRQPRLPESPGRGIPSAAGDLRDACWGSTPPGCLRDRMGE